jgi:hypothetical protein
VLGFKLLWDRNTYTHTHTHIYIYIRYSIKYEKKEKLHYTIPSKTMQDAKRIKKCTGESSLGVPVAGVV